ncbi:MAG: beta-N-acetylhexosaminidase [Gammaproteobacteria bacterium]|nr:beta-N-acetylhexosaminidase [Gammaproteobacteria bacterium]
MTLGPLMIDIAGTSLTAEDRELLRLPGVGGVILFTRNFDSIDQLQQLTTEIRELRRPSLLIAVDQEGGRVQRFRDPFTPLPAARTLGTYYDANAEQGLLLARTCGWLMAAELRACGVDLSFAPVVDLDYHEDSVIGDRACHRDAQAVAKIAQSYIDGMHEAGMKATAKHFPGHGAVADDSHLTLPVDERPLEELIADVAPYRATIAAGLDSIMMAFVSFPAVDEQPAVFSTRWIGEILRARLGFNGVVFSDDLSMAGAAVVGSMWRRYRTAVESGCDMILVCNDRDAAASVARRIDSDQPVSQARRATLHGRRAPGWRSLQSSRAWRNARSLIDSCFDGPELDLDG